MTDHDPIKAVPTEYAGTVFRSRLEADWAQTLTAHRIIWEYEPQMITLPSGGRYLPDFWLPELGTWIEVKGPNTPRIEKARELGETRTCNCLGICTCQWPGGELVILGWQSTPSLTVPTGRRPPAGYANWQAAYGPTAYHVECPDCTRHQWITLRRPWKCRACRADLEGQTLYQAYDQTMRFTEGPAGRPLTADEFARTEPDDPQDTP